MKSFLQRRPVQATALFFCSAVGAVVVLGGVALALLPVAVGLVGLAVGLLFSLLVAWAGIEGMAALERWFERDSRFHQ